MIWSPGRTLRAVKTLRGSPTLAVALARLREDLGEAITEGMLKGLFHRQQMGGVREHVGLDMPTVPKKVHAAATPAARPVSSIRESKKGPRLYVVLSDVHIPYHDEDALEAVCGLMKDLSPHGLVLNGDFLDLLELSRHSAGSVAKLEGRRVSTTFSEARRILNMLQEAAGAGCIDNHFIDGNHEDRVGRWLSAGDNGVFADDLSVDITSRLDLKDRGFKHHAGYPDAGVSLGKLWVTHGRFTNKYHAAKMLDYYRHSVMYGHTHVPQTHCASALHGQQVAYGTGYLADERSEAMSYAPKPNAWVKGFALVYVWPDESFNAQVLNFWRGQFAYGGKVYGRRLSK